MAIDAVIEGEMDCAIGEWRYTVVGYTVDLWSASQNHHFTTSCFGSAQAAFAAAKRFARNAS